MLALVLAALVIEFALFESTKRFVYWVAAVPFLCVALAALLKQAASWWREGAARRLAAAIAGVLAVAIAAEGLLVGAGNLRDSAEAASHRAAGMELEAALSGGAVVLTDNRMWPALEALEPRSWHLLFYWTNPAIAGERATDVTGAMDRIDADYLVISPITRELLAGLTARDAEALRGYLSERARLVATVGGLPYGPFEIYERLP